MVATGTVSADDAARAAAERIDVLPRSDGIAAAPHLLFRLAGGVPPGRDARAHDDRQRAASVRGERGAASRRRFERTARARRRGDRTRQPRRRDPRLRRIGRLLRTRGRRQERRRGRAAPAGLDAQAVPLRAGVRAARDSTDDDSRGRSDHVRPAALARVQPRRLQRTLRRTGARAHRAGRLAQRAGGARAQRRRRGAVSRPAARAGLPAPDEGSPITTGSGSRWATAR